jgi:hypothetical protein
MQEIFGIAEDLLVSQDGRWSMELVMYTFGLGFVNGIWEDIRRCLIENTSYGFSWLSLFSDWN